MTVIGQKKQQKGLYLQSNSVYNNISENSTGNSQYNTINAENTSCFERAGFERLKNGGGCVILYGTDIFRGAHLRPLSPLGGLMENSVAFTVKGSGNLFYLSAGRTLINFIEFDFGPFYRECQALAERSLRTRHFDEKEELTVKDRLRSCHPYFAACYNTVFDQVVLDCVIDILCAIEGIGLEAMWAKNISAADSLGQTVFRRISDYKTGHAVNQWANLLRMQRYAEKKAGFIFDEAVESPVELDVREMYFDLAFSTAKELSGCRDESAPAIRCTPTGLLSAAPELLSPVSGMAASVIGTMPKLSASAHGDSDCLRELNEGVVCAELMRLPLPDKLEMITITKKLGELPRRTYVPESLKAVIDLEIDELLERQLMLERRSDGHLELTEMYRPAPEPETEKQYVYPGQESLFTPDEPAETAPDAQEPQEPEEAEAQEAVTGEQEEMPAASQEEPPTAEELSAEPEPEEPLPFEPAKLYKPIQTEPEPVNAPDLPPTPAPAPSPWPEPLLYDEPKIVPVNGKSAKAGRKPKPVAETAPIPEESAEEKVDSDGSARMETVEQNRAAAQTTKMEVRHIASPVAEIAMLSDNYGRKPRKDRRSAPMSVPDTTQERMQLLQRLASDKRRSVRRHEGQDVDVFCQSVHTALSAAMRDEYDHNEEEQWAKLLFRIRGGVMTRRYSTDYLYRFLDATVEMYSLSV